MNVGVRPVEDCADGHCDLFGFGAQRICLRQACLQNRDERWSQVGTNNHMVFGILGPGKVAQSYPGTCGIAREELAKTIGERLQVCVERSRVVGIFENFDIDNRHVWQLVGDLVEVVDVAVRILERRHKSPPRLFLGWHGEGHTFNFEALVLVRQVDDAEPDAGMSTG